MAEEGTLGLARAHEQIGEDLSKEQLQRELDQARDSISHTVTEIKETVANQVQAVKDTLDWREQFRRRPVAWSAGAAGAGFLIGYGVAAAIKGDRDYAESVDYYAGRAKSTVAQPMVASQVVQSRSKHEIEDDKGPGFFAKVANTNAYGRVREEVGDIGNSLVKELSNTAKQLVLPALMNSLRNFIGGYLPSASSQNSTSKQTSQRSNETYEPRLERT